MAMKFRAHDTFFIRKGWLNKGMKHVHNRADVFVARDENPTDILGIGTNMVKALRYWLQAVGVTQEPAAGRRIQHFTDLGALIYEHDLYFFPCKTHADDCRNQDKGSQLDKQPLKGVVDSTCHGKLRVTKIPAQIGTVDCQHSRKQYYNDSPYCNQRPVQRSSSECLSPCKLQIEDLQLFRERFYGIHL